MIYLLHIICSCEENKIYRGGFMEKICPVCNKSVEEEALVCPYCGYEFNTDEETKTEVLENSDNANTDINEENDDANTTTVKSGKVVRFVAAFLALLLIFFGGKFIWSNFGPGSVISVVTFNAEKAVGTYIDNIYGRYYTLKKGAEELKDERTSSSDASEGVSYDGTYESGFTEEYIQSVLVQQYIIDNNLTEEYDAYLKSNDLILDDYQGFASKKKITKEELDKIDQEYQYVQMGQSYTSTGFWKYDKRAEVIIIYDNEGTVLSTLAVKRQGLVADSGYMAGGAGFGKTFNAKFVGKDEEYGISETICTYNDGMCISTVVQGENEQKSYTAGTYKVKDGVIVFYLGNDTLRYRIVTGGLGFLVYTR